jgi:hypothetical protein
VGRVIKREKSLGSFDEFTTSHLDGVKRTFTRKQDLVDKCNELGVAIGRLEGSAIRSKQ